MSKQKVHPSTKDLNQYGGYEINPIGSNQKAPTTKQNPSVSRVHRPNLAPMRGNNVDNSRDHIQGPQSANRFNSPAPFKKEK